MKGKGRSYTYWLDEGTKFNDAANPEKIKQLRQQVKTVLSKKKWLKRRYFGFSKRQSTLLLEGNDDTSTTVPSVGDLLGFDEGSIATDADTLTQTDDSTTDFGESSSQGKKSKVSDHDTHSFTEVCSCILVNHFLYVIKLT